ncbi:MAG: hypothetical protein AAB449_01535 [Patescibacteria group bacterium]
MPKAVSPSAQLDFLHIFVVENYQQFWCIKSEKETAVANQRSICGHIVEIDDLSETSWCLKLDEGWTVIFPKQVSNRKFENGDTVIIDLQKWSGEKPQAHLYCSRDDRLVTHFVFGDGCQLEPPEGEWVLFDGGEIKVEIDHDENLKIGHVNDPNVGLQVYQLETDTPMLAAEPRLHSMMQIGQSDFGPRIKFVEED